MAQRRRGRRGGHLLLGLVGVLGAMRLMAERRTGGSLVPHAVTAKTVAVSPEDRDAAFMERLRCLAREALSWAWLTPQQRLVWAAAIELDAVPLQELPPWFWERRNVTLRHPGVDLLSLDGRRAVRCIDDTDIAEDSARFVRVAQEVYKVPSCTLVTSTASTRLS
ncbi:unnamed protein product, partial [Durusdinium trenchii]